jgi:hypothetical protein
MKSTHILLLLLAFTACNTTTDDNSGTNNQTSTGLYRKSYDASKGGVQVVAIQADQSNSKNDEWVVLQTNSRTSLNGWHINAGDPGQDYTLYSFIDDSLLIYTHADPDAINARDTGLALSSGKFIWNNEVPDTCRLYNSTGLLVYEFTYHK